MSQSKVKLSVEDDVAVITLSDPATMNAAGVDMVQQLGETLRKLAVGQVTARAIVLTGEGRGFCSGANLGGSGPSGGVDADGLPDAGRGLELYYNPVVTLMRESELPIVTAVNGAAAGVGCSFALMGDMIVAGESAYFLQAFRRIGLVPDGGSTYILPRLIGKARAMEMALMGDKIFAKTALDWGLINRCVPDADLMPTAMEIARALAKGPKALGAIRQLIWESLDQTWQEQLHAERLAQRIAGKTADFREGVTAFLQKRPADFTGV
jgi:2-(1,2-epoxy-1,2-dihydrophenyl)acetyl-CoA isomerase